MCSDAASVANGKETNQGSAERLYGQPDTARKGTDTGVIGNCVVA